MTTSAAAVADSSADKPSTVSTAHPNDPAATPAASATPDLRPTPIDVPMIASTLGPGLAVASRKAEYAIRMPGR